MKKIALYFSCVLGMLSLSACGSSGTAWLLRDFQSSSSVVAGNTSSRHSFSSREGSSHSVSYAVIAKRFGMTEAEVAAEVKQGKTLMQIGTEHGIKFAAPKSSSSSR